MKNSSLLRGISYILMPILVAVIILSSFYVFAINEGSFITEEEFFNRSEF